ncbi:MAG: substrate-binding domain-containing protein [Proteobacteria bacterium]|nr:substrate-binding domain-containing protein [Pseudomonadota bacterium]
MATLRILSAGAVKGLVTALQPAFKADANAGIDGTFSAVGAIQDKFLAGEPCDVLILSQKMLEALHQRGNLLAGEILPLGIVRTGIAVRGGMAVPDITSPAALAAALAASDAIFIPDPERSTAGIFFVSVLKALGIYSDVERRLRPFPNGATAMRRLAESTDKNPMGCTEITEINYTPGITLAGPLPKEHDLSTVYSAAVSGKSANPELAHRFVALLSGPQSRSLRIEGGFEL